MIRATIVLLVACVVVPRLRGRSAAERYLLWAASLGMAAALPPLEALLPVWQPAWASRLVESLPTTLDAFPGWRAGQGPDIILRATGVEAGQGWTLGTALLVIWAIGACLSSAVLVVEVAKLARLLATTEPADERSHRIATTVAAALGLRERPSLLRSAQARVPITWGAGRPRVLLPATSADWSDEQLGAVLAHECGHIRRGDWTAHLVAQALCALYWFHPLFWIVERRMGREAEGAADDSALTLGLDGARYAEHLLAVVRASRVSAYAPVVAMARSSHLEDRVRALLRADANRALTGRRQIWAIAATTALLTVPLAAMTHHGTSLDVHIRTLNLPRVFPTNDAIDPRPMLPVVRVVETVPPNEFVRPPAISEYTTPPLYSEAARRRGVEGVVTIGARVTADGRVVGASVLKGLGFGLDQNALVAVRQWRFTPGTRSGRAVDLDVEVDVEFSRRTEAVNALIANDMATLVGPGVTPPRVVFAPSATPSGLGVRGRVMLDVVLLEDGTPKIVRILESLTPEADDLAVRHFEQWRFSPAVKNGRPVKVRMNAEVAFHG